MANKRRILIVDDHPIVRNGLAALIAQRPDLEVVGEAGTTAEATRLVKTTLPELVIVDIQLDGQNGIELIRSLKARYPDLKFLVSSILDETAYAERALRAGALGYITKGEAIRKILDAVLQVLQGKIYLSPRMSEHLLRRITEGQSLHQNVIEGLTNRELEIFGLIGQGLTCQEIAGKLHVSPRTVETHRQNIKRKLDLPNSVQLTRCALQWTMGVTR